MASGETSGVQMPFVLELKDEWHLEGAKSLNRPSKSAYLIALLPLGPPKIAYLIALCYFEVAKVL